MMADVKQGTDGGLQHAMKTVRAAGPQAISTLLVKDPAKSRS